MSIKITSIFVGAFILVGLMGFSIEREAPVQGSTISTPVAASLPRPGSPELYHLAPRPQLPLIPENTFRDSCGTCGLIV